MKPIAPEIAARRARAAVELAPYGREELEQRADHAGLRPSAFARIVAKKNPRGFKTIEELWAFADACEVPRWFLEDGLPAADDAPVIGIGAVGADVVEYLHGLDVETIATIRNLVELLQRGAIPRADEPVVPAPPGELGRRAEGGQPIDERQQRDESPQEEDRRRGAGG